MREERFEQLILRLTDPIQYNYEAIRPVVLFAEATAKRSRETEIPQSTINEKARRFVMEGMLGLVDQRGQGNKRNRSTYPEPIAKHIVYLKQLYPPIHYREIVRIIERKFGYKTSHHKVKRFLQNHTTPYQMELKIKAYHTFEDAYEARWQVVCLHYEGWNKKSIAGLLKLSHTHVGHIIKTFAEHGFDALEEKRSRPLEHPHNQMTLPFLEDVFQVQQEYPQAGRFRVHGILEQKQGEDIPSERTVGRAMAYNRVLHNIPDRNPPAEENNDPKTFPYRTYYRHQYWFIDIRHLVKIDGKRVYSICIIEGYSRKILIGSVTRFQDELAILQLLHAALNEYGCPWGIVSDNGAVFTANAYKAVLQKVEVEGKYIEKGKPWQNLIEAQFGVQARLADPKFAQCTTLAEVEACHHAFIQLFNTTNHWAHRHRTDNCTTPVTVLGWRKGRQIKLSQLKSSFRHLQFSRVVNHHGSVSVQRFYIYAERGLARKRVSVWIYEGRLHIEYRQHMLARYTCKVARQSQSLKSVTNPTLYRTFFSDLQMAMFALDDDEWLKILRRPPYASRKNQVDSLWQQLPLLTSLIFALCFRP